MQTKKSKLVLVTHREVSKETIAILEYLLQEAKKGNVAGIAFVALHHGYEFSSGISGKCESIPSVTRGMILDLYEDTKSLPDPHHHRT